MADASTLPYPQALRDFLPSSSCPSGRLVCWWNHPKGGVCVLMALAGSNPLRFELNIVPESRAAWGHDLHGYAIELGELEKTLERGESFYGAPWNEGDPAPMVIAAFVAAERRQKPAERLRNGTTLFLLEAATFERDYLYHPALITSARWKALVGTATEESLDLGAHVEQNGESVAMSPLQGGVVWDACRVDCKATDFTVHHTPSFFSDLESFRVPWELLPQESMPAWNAFVRLGGVSGLDPRSMPWWLHGAARSRESYAGILSPAQAQMISAQGKAMTTLFMGSQLQHAGNDVLAYIALGADKGCYCVSWEMGR